MTMLRTLLLAVGIAAGLTGAPALADRPHPDRDRDTRSERTSPEREQQSVLEATREGRSMTLPMLEQRVLPRMGGADYLGPEMRGETLRMKFMDQGKVIWVDVDPRTGRILGKSGH